MNGNAQQSVLVAEPWTFLTNHAAILLVLSRDPDTTLADLATATGLSHRWTVKIVNDLLDAHYVQRRRAGRSYTYAVDTTAPLRLDLVRHADIERLTALLEPDDDTVRRAQRQELAAQLRELRAEVAATQHQLQQLTSQKDRLDHALTTARSALATVNA